MSSPSLRVFLTQEQDRILVRKERNWVAIAFPTVRVVSGKKEYPCQGEQELGGDRKQILTVSR
jgi:hypothetical protein